MCTCKAMVQEVPGSCECSSLTSLRSLSSGTGSDMLAEETVLSCIVLSWGTGGGGERNGEGGLNTLSMK